MTIVSIIIPTYNYGKYVGRAIDSALDQNHRDIEVIVVDDGSTDDTNEIIQSAYRDKIRYFFQENNGASAARNNGFKESNGEYVIFLDADDFLGSDTISRFISCSCDQPDKIIYGPWTRYKLQDDKIIPIKTSYELKGPDILEGWLYGNYTASCSIFWPRKVIEALGGWDESLLAYQDGDIAIRALIEGFHFVYCKEAFSYAMYHPKNETSISNVTNSPRILHSKMLELKKLEKLLEQKNILNKYKKGLAASYYKLARNHILYIPDLSMECYSHFRRLSRFGKPPGSFLNWLFVAILGIRKKERLSQWLKILFT